jgi:hypothetical protein
MGSVLRRCFNFLFLILRFFYFNFLGFVHFHFFGLLNFDLLGCFDGWYNSLFWRGLNDRYWRRLDNLCWRCSNLFMWRHDFSLRRWNDLSFRWNDGGIFRRWRSSFLGRSDSLSRRRSNNLAAGDLASQSLCSGSKHILYRWDSSLNEPRVMTDGLVNGVVGLEAHGDGLLGDEELDAF